MCNPIEAKHSQEQKIGHKPRFDMTARLVGIFSPMKAYLIKKNFQKYENWFSSKTQAEHNKRNFR